MKNYIKYTRETENRRKLGNPRCGYCERSCLMSTLKSYVSVKEKATEQ